MACLVVKMQELVVGQTESVGVIQPGAREQPQYSQIFGGRLRWFGKNRRL